jgi:hypothetical protein
MNKKDINLKNIKAYVQGNLRYLTEQYGPEFLKMEPHIREQVMFRMDIANPECKKAKSCIKCGCDTPQLFYADKQCGGECYPKMMNKEEWKNYQKHLSNYSLENKIEIIEYPFDWEYVLTASELDSKDISQEDETSISNMTYDMGDVKSGDILEHEFILKNNTKYTKRVIDAKASCNCTIIDNLIGKYMSVGEELVVPVKVDTKNKKKPGPKSILVELTFNNKSRTRLIIKFNILENENS